MNAKIKNFIISNLILIPLSFLLTFYFWDQIKLNYINEDEIVGHYSLLNHNAKNDILRFIFFISTPVIIYLTTAFIFYKKELVVNLKSVFFSKEDNFQVRCPDLIIFNVLICFLLIFIFLSKNLPLQQLDIFHEGQLLSGGFNFVERNKLWSEIHVSIGLFVDLLFAPLSWSLFGKESIGSLRLFILLADLFTHLCLIFFFFLFVKNLNIKENFKILALTILFLFSVYLFQSHYLNYRDLPLILGFILILHFYINLEKSYLSLIFLSLLCVLSLFLSLEKGIYLNFTCIFFLIYFLFKKQYINFLIFIFNLILFWCIFYVFVGSNEFFAFLDNSLSVLSTSTYTNGQVYPHPFTNESNSARATKNLILIVINAIILLSILIFKNSIISNKQKIYLLIFFIGSLAAYQTALSHSDSAHLKQGIAFNYILFSFFLIILLQLPLKKLIDWINLKSKKIVLFTCVIILLFFSINKINIKNIYSFKSNMVNYINLDDSNFLSEKDYTYINNLYSIYKDEKCLQLLNYDNAVYFLIKKKTCTEYFMITDIGTKSQQIKIINEIKKRNLNYLVLGGPFDKWYVLSEDRFPYIFEYVENNYELSQEINSRQIYKKISN